MGRKIIENFGATLNLNEAENYLLCGALTKAMQRMGEKDFDYWFFSGITGDTFTQVFSRNFNKYYDCLSSAVFGKRHLDNIFNAIGYDYSLADNAEFYQNPEKHLAKTKKWVDNDVPVIVKDTSDSWYSLAVGYEDEKIIKFDMLCDKLQAFSFNLSEKSNYSLVFIGGKTRKPDLAQAYRNAVLAVPALLNKASTDEASFGRQAFIDWANSLLAGRSEFLGEYFDWAGTNAHMKIVLRRALALNPDLRPFIEKLEVFAEMNSKLFWHKNETLQAINEKDKEKLEEISAKIKKLAICCDDIIGVR